MIIERRGTQLGNSWMASDTGTMTTLAERLLRIHVDRADKLNAFRAGDVHGLSAALAELENTDAACVGWSPFRDRTPPPD